MTIAGSAQEYWSQTYDLFDHEKEDIRNIVIEDSIIYASCRGSCWKDSISQCFKMANFNLDGLFIDGREDTSFESGYGLEIDDEWLYVDGGNEPSNTRLTISRISKDFFVTEMLSTGIDSAYELINTSCVSNDKYIIAYGAYDDLTQMSNNSGGYNVNSVQLWINKKNFAIDTVISIVPSLDFFNIYDMELDAEGHIFSIGIDNQLNENGFKLRYHRIIKQDTLGQIVWDYTFPQHIRDQESPNDLLIFDDKIIFNGYDEDGDDAVHAISKDGILLWSHTLDHDWQKNIYPYNLVKSIDGHFFISGSQLSLQFGWRHVGFITKFDQYTGAILWDRTFEIDKGLDNIAGVEFSKKSAFWDLEQNENGDIYAAGFVDEPYNDPDVGWRHDKDLWLLKLDSMGCLVPNCGYIQSIKNGVIVNDSCKWLEDDAEWYYSAWGSNPPSQDLSEVQIIDDTLIGNRVCSVIGHFLDGEFIEGSQLVMFYDFENQKVFFHEDEEFKMLYDFSFGNLPGDTIEYYLPKNFGLYDISSTGGGFDPSGKKYKYRYIDQEWVNLPSGEQLRIVETLPIPENDGEMCYAMPYIIDGVGSSSGLIGRGCNFILGGEPEYFRCFKSDALEYSEVGGECKPTSTSEIPTEEVNIYPNPTVGELKIESEVQFSIIKVYDVAGQTVLSQAFTNTLDLAALPNGIYAVELRGEKGIYRTKIVKGN